MIEAYKKYLINYANFKGRSTVSDFWFVLLVNFLLAIVLSFLPELAGVTDILNIIYKYGLIIPTLSLTVRRLHDINKSGWYCLISLIPLFGPFIILGYMMAPSFHDNNKY